MRDPRASRRSNSRSATVFTCLRERRRAGRPIDRTRDVVRGYFTSGEHFLQEQSLYAINILARCAARFADDKYLWLMTRARARAPGWRYRYSAYREESAASLRASDRSDFRHLDRRRVYTANRFDYKTALCARARAVSSGGDLNCEIFRHNDIVDARARVFTVIINAPCVISRGCGEKEKERNTFIKS